jgi:pyruvate kinase
VAALPWRALSLVREAKDVTELRTFLAAQKATVCIVAKI